MPRVKGGSVAKNRRRKILKLAKGYYGSRSTLYKTAHEQVMKSLAFAYRDRKQRKRQFRKLWIARINAAAVANGIKYSRFINGLAIANVEVNRKMLADIAVHEPKAFTAYVEIAKKALENKPEKEVAAPKFNVQAALNAAVAKEKQQQAAKLAAQKPAVKVEPAKDVAAKKAVADRPAEVPVVEEVPVKQHKIDLEKLSVAELKELAVDAKLTGISKLKKAELIQALRDLIND